MHKRANQMAFGAIVISLVFVAGILALGGNAEAADPIAATWIGGTGNWSDPNNWDISEYPDNGSNSYNVFIDGGDAQTDSAVSQNVSVAIDNLTIDLNDVLSVQSGGIVTLTNSGVISNSGSISLDSGGALHVGGTVTLGGGGTIEMVNHGDIRALTGTGNDAFINEDNTIIGMGSIRYMTLTNRGTIEANIPFFEITLIPDPNFGPVVNSGTLRASNGGRLILGLWSPGTCDNTGGTIEALDGSEVFVGTPGTTINGGTMAAYDSGVIKITTGDFSEPTRLRNVALAGNIESRVTFEGQNLVLEGDISNSGSFLLDSGTEIYIDGEVTLTGGGTLDMTVHQGIEVRALTGTGDAFINEDNTIIGMGFIGYMPFTNKGTVEANISGMEMLLIPDPTIGPVVNSGTLRSSNGARLRLALAAPGTWDNTGGTIEALDSSEVFVGTPGTTINGGTVAAYDSGVIKITTGNSPDTRLRNVTLGGNIESRVTFEGQNLVLEGDISNSGSFLLDSGTEIYIDGVVTLTGGGTLDMTVHQGIKVKALTGTGDAFINEDNTIIGMGFIGYMPFTNQGTVEANISGMEILLIPDPTIGPVVNSGTLRASNGGRLILSLWSPGTCDNTGGTIEALDGSEVLFSTAGTTINGGTVAAYDSGVIKITTGNSPDTRLRNVTLGGNIESRVTFEGQNLVLEGDISNSGSFLLDSSTYIYIDGEVTLTGGGTLDMTVHQGIEVKALTGTGDAFINEDNTIIGMGFIGYMPFTNQGTVEANISGMEMLLIPDPTLGPVVNSGTMRASNGARLMLSLLAPGTWDNTGGTIEALDSSEVLVGSEVTINNGTLAGSGKFEMGLGSPAVLMASDAGTLIVNVNIEGLCDWVADEGKIQLNSGVDATTTGEIEILNGGELELNDANMTGSNLNMDATGIIDINSKLSLSGDFSFAMTDESLWSWDPSSQLEMTGGSDASVGDWDDWAQLEIGGYDLGLDPATHTPDPAGFSSNFELGELVIGPGAHLIMVDQVNNGNREGPFGQAEALYVDTLVFADSSSLLFLNGLHIYYNTLVGDPCQILDNIYVDSNAIGNNNGLNWADAYNYLADALNNARLTYGYSICVAEGTYRPDEDTNDPYGTDDRGATFDLISGVAIYGGFPSGGGTWGDRDPNRYETILSGDLLENDGPDFANNDENSYHVVTGSGTDPNAVLYGFIITRGNADGTVADNKGGGMFNSGGSPTVTNCTFSRNSAVRGGGMWNEFDSSPTVTNCIFSGNSATFGGGGGMYNRESNPIVTNCTFSGNSANFGGGMYNLFNSPTLTNCTFSGNSAGSIGGGMLNNNSSPTVTNCILWGDTAASDGNEIAVVNSSTIDVNYCDVQGGQAGIYNTGSIINWGSSNIDAEPMFKDADGIDNTPGTEDDNLQLAYDSSCIDAGDSNSVPADYADLDEDDNTAEQTPLDLAGNARFTDDPLTDDTGTGTPPIVDMGAYERYELCGDAKHPYPTGDFSQNCFVNLEDFAIFAMAWLTEDGQVGWNPDCNLYDLDLIIDISDLGVLAKHFLKYTAPD